MPTQCRDGWYLLNGECVETCPAGMTQLGISNFRRRCLAPFECQNGRIQGQDVNYGCRCATEENTPSACQFCSFRADEHGEYCTRCLGATFLYANRCQANCDGLFESEGLISYIPGNCECPAKRARSAERRPDPCLSLFHCRSTSSAYIHRKCAQTDPAWSAGQRAVLQLLHSLRRWPGMPCPVHMRQPARRERPRMQVLPIGGQQQLCSLRLRRSWRNLYP